MAKITCVTTTTQDVLSFIYKKKFSKFNFLCLIYELVSLYTSFIYKNAQWASKILHAYILLLLLHIRPCKVHYI